ncbi:hypothetical protein AGOR_G00248590 [Albula goreensis]|uniref:Interleukin-17 receptor C/E N-terminal domain-containing protein n=1 Tax=Albula goreensis TaxID=1534307 RepID=A0A8T3CGR2_9TELE|nr:hypothetical protein AGOR_G00248590 [Albula goreensis]
MRLAGLLLLAVCRVLTQEVRVERVQECTPCCTQELQCREKPHISFAPCKRRPKILNHAVFHSVRIVLLMKCEREQKCTLYLKVTSSVQISEHLRGMTFCVMTAGMLERCRAVTFHKTSIEPFIGQEVGVQSGCFEVGPGQDVFVTLKTIPHYCNMTWSQRYHVQGCHNEDLRNTIAECITGKIAYTVDMKRQELAVTVSDMLMDRDYHLRLYQEGDTLKTTTFSYSRALPCLCIEGWSAMVDARRIQVCPFRNRTEELWTGVNFDPEMEVLSWEPACPVEVVTTLCQKEGEKTCLDLVNSTQATLTSEVRYYKVDPNPRLCLKFTTDAGSWIKCPFEKRNFPGNGQWEEGRGDGWDVDRMKAVAVACLVAGITSVLVVNLVLTVFKRRHMCSTVTTGQSCGCSPSKLSQ